MAALYDTPAIKPFLIGEADEMHSRDNIVVAQSGTAVESGTVLTQIKTATTGTFAMKAGATGNPTSGTITVTPATAQAGVYYIRFRAATKFDVEAPNGVQIGNGTVGTAFNKSGLAFTLTAGGTAAVDGDEATITVAAGSGKYVPYTANAAAGTADALLYRRLPAATGDFNSVGITSHAEVNRKELTGLDATAEAQLRTKGIKVRGVVTPTVSTPAL